MIGFLKRNGSTKKVNSQPSSTEIEQKYFGVSENLIGPQNTSNIVGKRKISELASPFMGFNNQTIISKEPPKKRVSENLSKNYFGKDLFQPKKIQGNPP
jgi:hypothetical protein